MCRISLSGMMGAPHKFTTGLSNSPVHCTGKEFPMHNGYPILARVSSAFRRFGNALAKVSLGKHMRPGTTYPEYPPFGSNVCADRLAAPSSLTSFCTSVTLLSCTRSCPVTWTRGWWSSRNRGTRLCRQAGCNKAGDKSKPGNSEDRMSYQSVFSRQASLS